MINEAPEIVAAASFTHLDGEAENLDAHPADVWSCNLPHQFSKLVPVLVDLLYSQGTCTSYTVLHTPLYTSNHLALESEINNEP